MTPVELSRTVRRAVRRAVDSGELSVAVPERVVVTPPRPGGCGDYASNVALQLARPAGQPALRVAHVLRGHLLRAEGIDDVSVTGPGFLNISLRGGDTHAAVLVERILRSGAAYGCVDHGGAEVGGSASTSHVVHLRAACEVRAVVVADVLARLLRAQGAAVSTSSAGEPSAAWGDVLGARLDSHGAPTAPPGTDTVTVRPVPAPADPLPLGRDAGRWALLLPAGHDRPRISADPHLVQRESNPLFRVRYAHARTRALTRNAADLGFHAEPGVLSGAEAEALLGLLADYPRILARAAELRAPDVLARHLVGVADAVTPFLAGVLPVGEEKPSAAHRARLALAEAAGTVLAGGLSLLGIDAPDHL